MFCFLICNVNNNKIRHQHYNRIISTWLYALISSGSQFFLNYFQWNEKRKSLISCSVVAFSSFPSFTIHWTDLPLLNTAIHNRTKRKQGIADAIAMRCLSRNLALSRRSQFRWAKKISWNAHRSLVVSAHYMCVGCGRWQYSNISNYVIKVLFALISAYNRAHTWVTFASIFSMRHTETRYPFGFWWMRPHFSEHLDYVFLWM